MGKWLEWISVVGIVPAIEIDDENKTVHLAKDLVTEAAYCVSHFPTACPRKRQLKPF